MVELLKIQKTFRRLKVLFIIFAALCFALALFAAVAAFVWGAEGENYLANGGFFARVAEALDFGGDGVTLGIFITDAISFIAVGILLIVTVHCLKAELKEGTPFSEKGARRVKVLGLLFFFVSLATELTAVVMRETFSVASAESIGVVGGMATGVTLLVMSSLMKYGTVLQDMLMIKDVPDMFIEYKDDFEEDDDPPETSEDSPSVTEKLIAEAEKEE